MDPKKSRPFRLRKKSVKELEGALAESRKELTALKINKVTAAVASKMAKIKVVRKDIARVLTLINEKKRAEFKDVFRSPAKIRKFNEDNNTAYSRSHLPKALRPRKTRALRRALTKTQQNKKLLKVVKRQRAFPQRSFFVKA